MLIIYIRDVLSYSLQSYHQTRISKKHYVETKKMECAVDHTSKLTWVVSTKDSYNLNNLKNGRLK